MSSTSGMWQVNLTSNPTGPTCQQQPAALSVLAARSKTDLAKWYHATRRHINNRRHSFGHQPAAPGGCAASGWKFQHQPGCTIGTGVGQGDCSGNGRGGAVGHEQTLPSTAQALVVGRSYMGHATGRPGGALPKQLHPGNRQSSVPERRYPGCKAQHGPLPDIGVPPQSRACRTVVLPREAYMIPHQASDDPR